ncbi:MAG: acyltransferase family protein [Pseudomonadota bacterium]
MDTADRLHALDAVRAIALLLGVVLHSAAAFLQDFPMAMWRDQPSAVAAVIYFTIHMFRMSAFFLIAGFFARMQLERRGVRSFIKDRAKRVGVPLLFFPLVLVSISLGLVAGALPHGVDFLMSLVQAPPAESTGEVPAAVEGGGLNFAHLWFLYYLLLFYALALVIRTFVHNLDPQAKLAALCDRLIAFLLSGPWGPVLIALPVVGWLWQFERWNEWLGLPAPTAMLPDMTALIGYGAAFGLGWLLHRQIPRLLALEKSWPMYLALAVVLTIVCLKLIGTTPHWQGPVLAGDTRLYYTFAYVIGLWCWIFAFIGAAVKFLSAPNARVRYLADASYWIYLLHMSTIIFVLTLLRPYDLHWGIKFVLMVAGSLPLLLLSYHYLVRFTLVGAILNGRRHERPLNTPAPAAQPQS